MQDADHSYDQLFADNTVLRQRVATLEAALAEQTERETVFEANERRYQHWMENTLGLLCVHDLNGIILESTRRRRKPWASIPVTVWGGACATSSLHRCDPSSKRIWSAFVSNPRIVA